MDASNMIKMVVKSVTVDPESNVPYVLLEGEDTPVQLPIWIGILEASSIAWQLEGMKTERPMTHDLMRAVLSAYHIRLRHVEIVDLRENTYYAVMELELSDVVTRIDCRPSDAIALALREKVPIYVNEAILERIKATYKIDLHDINNEETRKKWKNLLERLNPEDFGKYKM